MNELSDRRQREIKKKADTEILNADGSIGFCIECFTAGATEYALQLEALERTWGNILKEFLEIQKEHDALKEKFRAIRAERDRYKKALEEIGSPDQPKSWWQTRVAQRALQEGNGE